MVIIYNSADKRKQKILIRKLNGNSLQFGRKKKTDMNNYETSQTLTKIYDRQKIQ
jgi:hypothetical protein